MGAINANDVLKIKLVTNLLTTQELDCKNLDLTKLLTPIHKLSVATARCLCLFKGTIMNMDIMYCLDENMRCCCK